MGRRFDWTLLLGLQCVLWIFSPVLCQVNCPANAEYRQGAGCFCLDGYERNVQRTGCIDLNECVTGGHQCLGTAVCVNLEGTYRCDCSPGFELAQVPSGYVCRDINECTANPRVPICGQNEKCENSPGSYRCTCREGFSQLHSGTPCADLDECMYNAWACHPKANCTNTIGGYLCSCNPGFVGNGNDCIDIDECSRVGVCGENARCTNTIGSFKCECLNVNQLSVVTKNGRTCTEMSAEELLQANTEASNYLAIGVGVGVAVLVLIIVIIIVAVVIMKRRSEDKELPGLSMADGIQITPVGIDGHHYENVPTPSDVNYITVIADPVGTVRSNLVTGNYNDLYSNNKIIKSKNIYNDTTSTNADNISVECNENLSKVVMKPQNRELVIPEVRRTRKPYEKYSTHATVVTPGARSAEYDTYNMLWDKINKDIEAIKPTLKSQGSKVVEVSRTLSGGSNYDHLGAKQARVMSNGDTNDYNHIYDRSGQTSF